MISRREMLKRGSVALAAFAAKRGWVLSGRRQQAAGERLTSYVDPFIGSGGHGHTYPGAQVPFGMVQLSPDNGVSGWDWSSGYHWSSDRIVGFSHTHLSGTGIGDLCDILVMPAFTARAPLPDVSSGFSHERERAAPGYYSVDLLTGITAELTATTRVGVHRYSFNARPESAQPSIVIDLGHSLNWDRPTDTMIRVESPTLVSGHRRSTGWAPDQHVYFAAGFSRPFVSHWLESEWTTPAPRDQLQGERVKACFQLLAGQRITLKVGISATSIDAARRNLQTEMPGWDFDATRRAATDAWERALSRVQIGDATAESRILLYTALYHALLAPQTFADADGAYRGPDGSVHRSPGFTNHSVFSLWDTFRAQHPLLTLVQPERVDDLVKSMMAFYGESGLLPVWPLVGNETNTMIGYHAVPVILEALSKNLTRIEPSDALKAMIQSATQNARGLEYYQLPEPKRLSELEDSLGPQSLRRIKTLSRNDLQRFESLLNGYVRSIAGDTIDYHSPSPRVSSALLVRTESGDQAIEWETDLVPEALAGRPITFVWLAGIDTGADRHRFHLSVNERPAFEFRGPRPPDEDLSVTGPDGSRLAFRATHTDRYDDLFGFMFLTLPNGLDAGERLRLRVTGEAAGTSDWYMTFERPMSPALSAENLFAFLEDRSGRRQAILADIYHLYPPTQAEIGIVGGESRTIRLAFGPNRAVLPAPSVREATPVTLRLNIEGRVVAETDLQLRPVRRYEYVPADWESESVSKTLEYAYDDWCIAELATTLGEAAAARRFRDRAGFYRNVFDPSVGFMRGRLSDGSWKDPFVPHFSSQRQSEYTEGNAWQYSWFVPHDIHGLIALMGGRRAFVEKLDELFESSWEAEGTNAPPDVSGLIGQYAQGNEPSHHIAYLYCYAGAPWKTQERVRQITDTLFGTRPDGLPGNEDCGQMSAWYIFSTIGFYPVNPAQGIYVIGTPHFERITLDVGGGRRFRIEAAGTSSANRYIQSVRLDGRSLDRAYLTHEEIVAGGVLEFRMGDQPNRAWASQPSAAPPSMSR